MHRFLFLHRIGKWPNLKRCKYTFPALFIALASNNCAIADEAIYSRRVNLGDWQWDPAFLLNVAFIIWLYSRGLIVIRQSLSKRVKFNFVNVLCFSVGMLLLLVCLISPLDALSSQLASAHMTQHMTIMTVAAPLIAFGSPTLIISLGFPTIGQRLLRQLRPFSKRLSRTPTNSLSLPWFLYAATMWGWHYPVLYEAALGNRFVHDLQHISFFCAALLFWQPIVDPLHRPRTNGGLAVLYLFTTTLHATILGVFMTVAPTVWYSDYNGLTELWGLTALEDQQLAGLIMWMPACLAYAAVAIWLFSIALARDSVRPAQFAGFTERK